MAFVAEENQLSVETAMQRDEEARLSRLKFLESTGKATRQFGISKVPKLLCFSIFPNLSQELPNQ